MSVLLLLAALTCSHNNGIIGAPVKSSLAPVKSTLAPVSSTSDPISTTGKSAKVWIFLDYPPSVKTPSPEDVKNFLYTLQQKGDVKYFLDNGNKETWSGIEWSIRTHARTAWSYKEVKSKEESYRSGKIERGQEDSGDNDDDGKNARSEDYSSDSNKYKRSLDYSSEYIDNRNSIKEEHTSNVEKETVVYTLPPNASNKDEAYEVVFMQLYYTGQFKQDLRAISCGMPFFVREFLNTTSQVVIKSEQTVPPSLTEYLESSTSGSSISDPPTANAI